MHDVQWKEIGDIEELLEGSAEIASDSLVQDLGAHVMRLYPGSEQSYGRPPDSDGQTSSAVMW